ncbi:hypothetical protein [Methylobacterium gnaphalii]|uniref:Tetratricopeptide repeat-like domain-containing protein n=1 Tax=Methylobacterium gnaphalii TaxID=1010610 RepID=A0A512JH72_9HYPH|nr:hypothetical protein [Methylobacterium gnaphalii]GEP09304.1 hypothetical protein MGN01_11490 [Methylobacterium gnaphalii]GJD71049.1 hypothetical protein MMMDOFMJ_4003 [Methylobacterium gnaphalii]GLS48468.1 hypothetical protein GCM10007885_13120 [Methylobacterium gnaphalii]
MQLRADGERRPRGARALLRLVALSSLLAAALPGVTAQAARLVSAKGSQPGGYGRIVLAFDVPVAVKARVAGTILTLNFGQTVGAFSERIAAGMPDFVSIVRRDPDGSALRLALQRGYRVNVQEAGEQVFVDLLPESWAGLPPPLPPETIAELARRAREAEAALKASKPPPPPRPVAAEISNAPGRTRISLRLPRDTQPVFEEAEDGQRLTLAGAWRIDDQAARGRLKPEIGSIHVENDGAGARLTAIPATGVRVETGRDAEEAVIDFLWTPPAAAKAEAGSEGQKAAAADTAKPAAAKTETVAAAPAAEAAKAPAVKPETRATEPPPRRAGSGLVFPFAKSVPAALFERAGIATLVFETAEPIAIPPPGTTGLVPLGPPQRVGNLTLLRFNMPSGSLVDLLPISEPHGWELAAGDVVAPSESLVVKRASGGKGRVAVGVALPDPGSVTWLDLDGERVAVVTAGPARRAGVPKPQRFVDFELLPSRVGLAVLANADDLAVRPDIDGISIERENGVVVSGITRTPEPPVAEAGDLVVERETWEPARRGDIGAMLRQKYAAAAEASNAERSAARLALAKALMANGLDIEALGVLTVAAAEDPVLDAEAQTTLMRGIVTARIGRLDEAEKILSAGRFARNPEARLWRGWIAARQGRWAAADASLNAGMAVLERYPEDISAPFYADASEASAELGDWDGALRTIRAATLGADALTRDRATLLRARIDEAKGGVAAALESYENLEAKAQRPVAAAASLRATMLAQGLHKIDTEEAIDRLETLTLTWHGGATEAETLGMLGRLYTEAGRWRQVFVTARRANILAPEAPATRAMQDAAQVLFEDLFLGERAASLGGVEALALYFDFKEFAPIGRRADEIVRRLADRLVALDLLDSADELLDHQVAHRLTGPARASVAARLATIRLMEGKPLEAYKVLEETHLPSLSEDLRRARALLRARALSDLSRTDLALETIEGESGPDAERLRADILWTARRWREAGEAHEALLGDIWRGRKPLDEAGRSDVIRAGIAYGLAGESLGLERLKAKFAGPMADGPDARTFALLTRSDAPRTPAFRDAARRATSAETLGAFLAEYRKRYPEAAVPERGSDGTASRAEASGTPTPKG